MGNQLSAEYINYAVPTDAPPYPDATPVFRSSVFPSGLVDSLPGVKWDSPWDCFQYILNKPGYRTKQFIASRTWDTEKLESFPPSQPPANTMTWVTYGQVEEMAISLARGLRFQKLVQCAEFPEELYAPARAIRPLGVISKNRIEWFVLEQATLCDGTTLVPLYDSLAPDAIIAILRQTQMSIIAASEESAKLLLTMLLKHLSTSITSLASAGLALHTILLFDRPTPELEDLAAKLEGLKLEFWKDVVQVGRQHPEISIKPQEPDDVGTLCYTSGTTGAPKGVIITAKNFASLIAAHQRCCMNHPGFKTSHEDIHISYLPLAHVFERLICANCICLGVRIACYSGDTQKLLDDMKIIKPTVFLSVPRLFMRINDKVFAGIKDKSAVAQYLFNTAVEAKLRNLRERGIVTHPVWDRLVFAKIRRLMGGQVKFMLVGGAPLESITQERISILFCCPVMHGYGMTEMGASFICQAGDRVAGHIGGVQPAIEFCLRSVPEMNYRTDGPDPCGELLVRGHSVSPGYLMNPAAFQEAYTPEGWLQSGDIAVLLPGNALKIIDRKKNIFKLSQGEYVAPERIEAVYNQSEFVGQVYVHGDSTKSALVAIVVPDEEIAVRWAQQNDRHFSSLSDIAQDSAFVAALTDGMEAVAKEHDLKGFEKVKKIHVEAVPFSIENGLLTPTLKLKRHDARQFYKNEFARMYEELGM